MSIIGLLTGNKTIFEDLSKVEKELEEIDSNLSEYYNFSAHLDILLTSMETHLISKQKKLEKLEFSKVERKLSKRYNNIFKKLERYTFILQKHVRKVKNGKRNKKNVKEIHEALSVLKDSIHELYLYAHDYDIITIKRRKIWKSILSGLRSNKFLPPDIGLETAKKFVDHYLHYKIVAVVQYNTNEKPYLFIMLDSTERLFLLIVKKGELGRELVISSLLKLLGIRHIEISSKTKVVNQERLVINGLNFLEGIPFKDHPKISHKKTALSYAYLLGAACADGFVVNLSDRHQNIFIDMKNAKYAISSPKKYLGDRNPLFHIDYDFGDYQEIEPYFISQFFGSFGAYFTYYYNIDHIKTRITMEELLEEFNKGFSDEMRIIVRNYAKNKNAIDKILRLNSLNYLLTRFSIEIVDRLILIERKVFRGHSEFR